MPQTISRDAATGTVVGGRRWWLLIVLPLVLLAILGARGIQRGRESSLENARVTAAAAVERAAERFASAMAARVEKARAVRLYAAVPEPPAAGPSQAEALFERALAQSNEEAEQSFATLVGEHPNAVTAAGLPLRPLIAWARLERCVDAAQCATRAEELARVAVEEHPSLLSGKLIERAAALLVARGIDASALDPWQQRWREDEKVRGALRRIPAVDGGSAPQWVEDGTRRWWVAAEDGGAWRILVDAELTRLASDVAGETQRLLPRATRLSLAWAGHDLLPAGEGERLASREAGPLAAAAILTDRAELFREQNAQALWLAALLSVALLAVLGGFLALQRALIAERRLNRQKSDFVASVSHELRTPVASMRLLLENLQSGSVSTESGRQEYTRLLGSECHRLSALIENILDFARIENNRKIYHMAEADVAAMLRDAVQLLQPHAAHRRQQIVEELQVIEPAPRIDALALQQAVINLIENAMKFSPPDTVITVSARPRDAKTWEISVADQGAGVPASEHTRIFERFYRLGNELRRETQGAGIGLAIVKHAVETHGGRIEVRSEPERGSTFVLILPFTSASD